MYTHAHFGTSESITPDILPVTPNISDLQFDLLNKIKSCHEENVIPQCCCYFSGTKLHVILTERLQQVQRRQINFAPCSKTWENLNTVMSVCTINYIILSSGVFLHLTEIFFCFMVDITISAKSLAPALLTLVSDLLSFQGTQQIMQGWHLQMAEFQERSLGAICSRKSPTCTMQGLHPRQGHHTRHPQGELPEDSTVTRKTGGKV